MPESSLPPWMLGPPTPGPEDGPPAGPRVIEQRPTGDGDVLVTWVLPGLVRATVRVPQSVWLDGDHHAIGSALAALAQPPKMPAPTADDVQDDVEQA